ncbi:choice-of-anchor D domain-containing protein [Flavobacteriaceae bacterium F08102]|nr:choice-of-anchor D domain-containing protein [Flavobacteriaceae bacterium F08102]
MMKKLLCTVVILFTFIGFATAQEEINVQGNGISIIGDGTNVPNVGDGTDFGQVVAGTSSVEVFFTIENVGTAPLTITSSVIVSSGDFKVTTLPSSPIAAGSSSIVGVTFDAPLIPGIYTGQLGIVNSDADENFYTVNITAESIAVPGPEINIKGNGFSIVGDGTNSPNVGDGTDFGLVDKGTSSTEHFFVIENTGTSNLTITSAVITGSGNFTVSTPPATTVAAGSSTTFGVTFNAPPTAGVYAGAILVVNDDTDENSYEINISGTSAEPAIQEIDITGNGNPITDGDTVISVSNDTDFGTVALGSTVTHTFTVTNTGTDNLFVQLPIKNDLGDGVDDWIVTDAYAFPLPPGASGTIDIEFTPTSEGFQQIEISIANNDSDENPFTFYVGGTGQTPEIEILGNATEIIDGQTTTSITDDTDFGTTTVGTPVVRTFTVNNTGSGDLYLNTPSFTDLGGGISDWATTAPSILVIPTGTTTFDVTFTPSTVGVQTVEFTLSNNDLDENPYTFYLSGEGILNEPEMNVVGNGIAIVSGDVTPDVADDTDFGQADLSSGIVTHTFTIENTGPLELNLTGGSPYVTIGGADASEFSLTAVPSSPIASANSTTFNVTFNPTSLGVKVATISIANDDTDENPYTFDIQGEGIDANAASPLLITQYYEGIGANDQWIEVTNVSNSTVLAGSYYLALYTDFFAIDGIIDTTAPNQSISIGTLAPGEVALYRNPSAVTPGPAFLGTPAISETTNVCTFDGDDVILISSTNGLNAYNNRIDIMGVVGPSTGSTPDWGVDTAFIKGCGTTESPSTVFDATVNAPTDVDVNDYIKLSLDEVNNALPDTNIQLGTQGVGPTEWTTTWSNKTPDRTRNVIISGTYNASDGDIISCDMTITGNLNFDSGTTNYVEVDGDLNIVGTFTIGDTESLYMGTANQDAVISGVITKYETTTQLNEYDFTYWGTPVANAAISSVFAGTSLGDVYYWAAAEPNVIEHGGEETIGEWIVATGTMIPGNGYIALGPQGGTYPLFQTVAFTGKPNNGTVSLSGAPHMVDTLEDGNEETDYNLVGNPYPSAISADEFLSTNNVFLDETIWFWTHTTPNNLSTEDSQYAASDYAAYNYTGGVGSGYGSDSGSDVPDGTIASGQGFLVKVINIDPIAKFTNKMRIRNQTGQFFRGTNEKGQQSEKDRIWLNVQSKTGGAASEMLIGFMDNATDGFDKGYDGTKNGAGWISIYGTVDEKKLSIEGLPAFSEDKVVPIGFDTYIDETMTYVIDIKNMEGALAESDVYLVDNELNKVHDLKQAPYEFTMDGSEFNPTRFSLKFTKGTLGVDDENLSKDFVVINKDNAFELRSNSVVNNLKVYDVLGRLLMETTPKQSTFEVNTSSIKKGTVLILLATFDNGLEISKKAIKY